MASQLSETIRVPPSNPLTELPFANPESISPITSSAVFQCPIVKVGKLKNNWLLDVAVDRETGHRFVAVVGHSNVYIYSENEELIHEFGDTHLRKPCGILIHQDSIYITDLELNALFQFRLPDLTMVRTVGSQGYAQENFFVPRLISISPDQYIYVSDQLNHRIQILSLNLKFHSSLRHYSMRYPVDVKFSNYEIFVLSHQEIPTIHVFTLSGEKSRMMEITENLGLKTVFSFCLDTNNDVAICDCRSDGMRVFSQNGNLLHLMALKRKDSEICFLARVKIWKNNKLICHSRKENFCIQILSV